MSLPAFRAGDGILFRRRSAWIGLSAVGLASLAHIAVLAYVFASRFDFPLDLEWMEGGMLCHALRIMQGKGIYVAPSVDFIPFLYTPLYPATVALFGKIFGLGYVVGRLISIISFFVACGIAFVVVKRHTGRGWESWVWATTAVGLIAASFPRTEAWFDLVRNDSLYLALVCTGLYLVCYHNRRWSGVVAAGVIMGLAFLTKQTASLFIIATGVVMLVSRWRLLPLYVLSVGLVAGGTTLIWNHFSNGWFWQYIFELHQQHSFYPKRLWPEAETILYAGAPVVPYVIGVWVLLGIALWVIRRRGIGVESWQRIYWLFMGVIGVAVAATGFSTQWAAFNAFIPGYFFPSIVCAIAGAALVQSARELKRGWVVGIAAVVVCGAIAAQLVSQRYAPDMHIPNGTAQRNAVAVIRRLSAVRGPILIPEHPFYSYLAGKAAHFHQMGILDVTRAGIPVPPEILVRLTNTYYSLIVLPRPPAGMYASMRGRYRRDHSLDHVAWPRTVTGATPKPHLWYVPVR